MCSHYFVYDFLAEYIYKILHKHFSDKHAYAEWEYTKDFQYYSIPVWTNNSVTVCNHNIFFIYDININAVQRYSLIINIYSLFIIC